MSGRSEDQEVFHDLFAAESAEGAAAPTAR